MSLKIGIVAGEASGDELGAGLIQALKVHRPDLEIEGIAGPKMIAAGCKMLFPMEELAVMGIIEVVKHAPRILRIRRKLRRHFLANPPDIFVGIDAPDFNLDLEVKLKKAGITTAHYVSPTVWAWRRSRLKVMKCGVRLLLSILPFEKEFYRKHSHIPVQFVGHPLADTIAIETNRIGARKNLNISNNETVIALLPGSRSGEIAYLGNLFVQTALYCLKKNPHLTFIAPMINEERRKQFSAICQHMAPQLKIRFVESQAQQVMAAADAALIASGTATLEAMLVKCPMVVAYRVSALTYFILKRMVKTSYIALPNLLANKLLVPEFIQETATPENLGEALLNYLKNPQQVADLTREFTQLHLQMRKGASEQAAAAILKMKLT